MTAKRRGIAETNRPPNAVTSECEGDCLPIHTARAVMVGWATWTGIVAFVVGRWWGSVPCKVLGWLWIASVILLVQEWADV